MSAIYNEIEPFAAQWLRNLSEAGHIAPGAIDARSIRDLRADDVVGATQFHTFAGLGAWSYALRLAGWPDDRPVWTGSCPCQPFSGAGKGAGFDDPRHLWPEWFRLIRECRPPVVLGEQVASPDGMQWLDLVSTDLEREGYAIGAADLCAAGVGAPHIRQRIYFVAYTERHEWRQVGADAGWRRGRGSQEGVEQRSSYSGAGDVAFPDAGRRGTRRLPGDGGPMGERGAGSVLSSAASDAGTSRGMADPARDRAPGDVRRDRGEAESAQGADAGRRPSVGRDAESLVGGYVRPAAPGPVNGFWADAEWLPCRDGRSRAAKPGTFPLAHGATSSVGRLRAYGNAIVPQVAATFVRAFMEAEVPHE